MTDAKNRVILLVDDSIPLMHKYHDWMAGLTHAYANLYNYSCARKLYDHSVYDIDDLDPTLDSIADTLGGAHLDLVITDFDLITANGNDVARTVRAKFPDTRIVGNTGGDPSRFDAGLVDDAYHKIVDRDTFYATIDRNTTLKLDTGWNDLFNADRWSRYF